MSRKWLWPLIGIAAVFVIAVIAVVSTRDDGDTPSSSPTDPTESPETSSEMQPVAVEGSGLAPFPGDGRDPAVGTLLPTVHGSSFDGTPVDLPTDSGRAALVVVMAHWCPHCNAEVPRLVEWQRSGGVPADLDVVGVSTDVRPSSGNYPPSQWVAEQQWPWPVMADDEHQTAAAALGVTGYPFMVVVSPDGTVLGRHSGELGSVEEIDAFVRAALSTSTA